jgi:hypothetical protein
MDPRVKPAGDAEDVETLQAMDSAQRATVRN